MAVRSKAENVLERVKEAIAVGNYIYSDHGDERQQQRVSVTDGDMKNAIVTGWHERKKDEWKEEYQDWNYSIRGHSLDGDRLRVVVALKAVDGDSFIIVTIINLDEEYRS